MYPSQDLSSKSVVPAGYTDNMQGLDRPSPFKLTATKRPEKNGLGLVDELDDPKPGHLGDHPTTLTATTRSTLEKIFVKSSGTEYDEMSRETAESENSKQAEDAEVEGMVLDNNSTAEDEDK
ncbi:hypothetical protein BU17DRAFT_91065 [Hysterangium stoloniferum]|nr:hypothetical protein BU17DRAFT_91065 [Hysterangium stoloniferum]